MFAISPQACKDTYGLSFQKSFSYVFVITWMKLGAEMLLQMFLGSENVDQALA